MNELLNTVLSQVTHGEIENDTTFYVWGDMPHRVAVKGYVANIYDASTEDYNIEDVQVDSVVLEDENQNALIETDLPNGFCEWELAKLAY